MLKSLKWQNGLVLSIKLKDDLFVICQMRENYLLEVFDFFSKDDDWENLNLSDTKVIFTIFISVKNMKKIFSKVLPSDTVAPNQRPVEKIMLSPVFARGNYKGADLIKLTKEYTNIDAEILKESLTAESDLDLLYRYELCGMLGDPEKLISRISIYHDSGVNWDPAKELLFPNIKKPNIKNKNLQQ